MYCPMFKQLFVMMCELCITNACLPLCTMQSVHIDTLGTRNSILDGIKQRYGQEPIAYKPIATPAPVPTLTWVDKENARKKSDTSGERYRSIPLP